MRYMVLSRDTHINIKTSKTLNIRLPPIPGSTTVYHVHLKSCGVFEDHNGFVSHTRHVQTVQMHVLKPDEK